MSSESLCAQDERVDRVASRKARRPIGGRSPWLLLGAWQPFVVFLASLTAVACFAAKPCSKTQPRPRSTLTGHEGSVAAVSFRPDGAVLSSVGRNGSIVLWNVVTLEYDLLSPVGPGQHRCVAFSPDGKLLAAGSPTQAVCAPRPGDEQDVGPARSVNRNGWCEMPRLCSRRPHPGRRTERWADHALEHCHAAGAVDARRARRVRLLARLRS